MFLLGLGIGIILGGLAGLAIGANNTAKVKAELAALKGRLGIKV